MLVTVVMAAAGAAWLAGQARDFPRLVDGLARSQGVVVQVPAWHVDWWRGIASANDVVVSLSAGGGLLLDIPRVEVDFRPWSVPSGWPAAVWQVYLHRPVLYADDAALLWWAAHVTGDRADAPAFLLQRLYADVVTVAFADGSRWDNGVLELEDLTVADGLVGGDFRLQLHVRSQHRKVSFCRRDRCGPDDQAIRLRSVGSMPVIFCRSASGSTQRQ